MTIRIETWTKVDPVTETKVSTDIVVRDDYVWVSREAWEVGKFVGGSQNQEGFFVVPAAQVRALLRLMNYAPGE